MLAHFIVALRSAGIPASITEYLTLLRGMKEGVAEYSVDDFYHLSRATLVKDERHLDRFDRVFGEVFKGLEPPEGDPQATASIPEEWLRKLAEKQYAGALSVELFRTELVNGDPYSVAAEIRMKCEAVMRAAEVL